MWEGIKATCSVIASPPMLKAQEFPHPNTYSRETWEAARAGASQRTLK